MGHKGLRGPKGLRGVAGPEGAVGQPGDLGSIGETGANGKPGISGGTVRDCVTILATYNEERHEEMELCCIYNLPVVYFPVQIYNVYIIYYYEYNNYI